jgi:hypothetical protein
MKMKEFIWPKLVSENAKTFGHFHCVLFIYLFICLFIYLFFHAVVEFMVMHLIGKCYTT